MPSLAKRVYAYAVENYSENFGWSVIVECWTIEQIDEYLTDLHIDTFDLAVKAFGSLTEVWDDRYMDAVNSAF